MKKQKKTFLIVSLIIISFFLNLFWEILHSLLYDWNILPHENNVYFFIPIILFATLGDVFYILIIFLLWSVVKKNVSWIYLPKGIDYIALSFFGIIFALFIEIKAKFLNLWQYNQYMPQIFGIGITPLIQLAVTSSLSLLIVNYYISNKRGINETKLRKTR